MQSCNSCTISDCGLPVKGRGLCNKHHLRLLRHGDPTVRKRAANGETAGKPCAVDGCGRPCRRRDWCSTHERRVSRYGDPHITKKLANGASTPERRREVARRAFLRYQRTPHGRLRSRFNQAKRRVLNGQTARGIDKSVLLTLWSQSVCALCGVEMAAAQKSLDHVIPMAKGGSNDPSNWQLAHLLCNQRKSTRMSASAIAIV